MVTPLSTLSLDLYKKLFLARRSEESIIQHYPQDEMKTPMHMSLGQEAVAVGVCHAISPHGLVLSSYRSHATFLAQTENVELFFAELYGRVNGFANGKSGSMHLADPKRGHWGSMGIVAGAIPIALGLAFAQKVRQTQAVTAVFFGDGAMDEGAFWESVNVASLMKLPILFVCEDNGLAVHTPREARQGYDSIVKIVERFHCATFHDESNDVESIYQMTQQAVTSVATGCGPAFLHVECYRYLEHVGIHDDIQDHYRPVAEHEKWQAKDAVQLQRRRLIVEQGIDEAVICALEETIEKSIVQAIDKASQLPYPEAEHLFQGIFYEGN